MTLDSRSARAWVVAVVVVLAALLGLACLLVAPESRKPLDDYVAAVHASGKPVTVEEVIGPPPPPETNGFVDFEAACKWLDEHAGPQDKWTYTGPWNQTVSSTWYDDETPERLAALDRFLASLRPFFDGLAAAVAKPKFVCAPTRDPSGFVVQSDVMRLPHVMRLVQARALAASRADVRLDSVALLLALSARIENRSAMAQIMAMAASRMAVFALRRELERGALDVVAARTKLEPLLVESWLSRVREVVAFQRVQMLDVAVHADFDGRAGHGTFSSLAAKIGDEIERAIRRTPAPADDTFLGSPKQFAEAHAAFAPLESLPTDSYPRIMNEVRAFWDSTKDAPFMQAWMPAPPGVVESFARTAAGARLARVALAVAEFRATHGEFPASLDELAPMFPDGVPLDPYTDAPFVCERTATGARIASVGRLNAEKPIADAVLRERCLVWELKR